MAASSFPSHSTIAPRNILPAKSRPAFLAASTVSTDGLHLQHWNSAIHVRRLLLEQGYRRVLEQPSHAPGCRRRDSLRSRRRCGVLAFDHAESFRPGLIIWIVRQAYETGALRRCILLPFWNIEVEGSDINVRFVRETANALLVHAGASAHRSIGAGQAGSNSPGRRPGASPTRTIKRRASFRHCVCWIASDTPANMSSG